MADTKISALTERSTSLDGTEEFPVAVSGANYKVKMSKSHFAATGEYTLEQFGATGDGSTDDSAAWVAFRSAAQTDSTAGRAVTLRLRPGKTYTFNGSTIYALTNIKKLIIEGNGATIKNIYSGTPANSLYQTPFFIACQQHDYATSGNRFLISTTTIGAQTVTCTTAAQAGNFSDGEWLMIGSLAIQWNGYPANIDRFEFAKVQGTPNTGTGVITLDRPIKHVHKSTFADSSDDNLAWGKARVWKLGNFGGAWDVEHVYNDLRILGIITGASGSWYYTVITGRSITFNRCTLPGDAPSFVKDYVARDCRFETNCEPDKCVESILYDNCHFDAWDPSAPYGLGTGISTVFSSSSINHVTMRNCYAAGQVVAGGKFFKAENCHFGEFKEGSGQGMTRAIVLENTRIDKWDYPYVATKHGTILALDANLTYSSGTFRLTKSAASGSLMTPTIGQAIAFCATIGGNGDRWPGQTGICYVTDIREDATYIYFDTTMPDTSTPSWASGNLRVVRAPEIRMLNCDGNFWAGNTSLATKRGWNPYGFFGFTMAGPWTDSSFEAFNGVLQRAKFNVRKATSVSNARLYFTCYNTVNPTTFGTTQDYQICIDLTVAGERDFTTTALTGKTTNDFVNLAGSGQTSLPNKLWHGTFYVEKGSYSATAQTGAVLDVEMYFDVGQMSDSAMVYNGLTSLRL